MSKQAAVALGGMVGPDNISSILSWDVIVVVDVVLVVVVLEDGCHSITAARNMTATVINKLVVFVLRRNKRVMEPLIVVVVAKEGFNLVLLVVAVVAVLLMLTLLW